MDAILGSSRQAVMTRRVLFSIVPIVAAVLCYRHLYIETRRYLVPRYAPSLIDECADRVAGKRPYGYPVLDQAVNLAAFLLCTSRPIVKEVVKGLENKLIWTNLAAFGVVSRSFVAVEASRSGAHWPLALSQSLVFGVYSLLSSSLGFTLFFLTLYLLFGYFGTDFSSAKKTRVSFAKVAAIGVLNLTPFVIALMLLMSKKLDESTWEKFLFYLQWTPLLLPLLWLPLPSRPLAVDSSHGHLSVIALHLLTGGLAFACHLPVLAVFFADPKSIFRILALYKFREEWFRCAYVHVVDLVALFGAMAYHPLVEDGPLVAVLVILGYPLVGGATFSLYYAYRELRIWHLGSSSASSQKKKDN